MTRRVSRLVGIAAPPTAAVLVLIAGAITPGYDPVARSVSWLAVPHKPGAAMVEVAIALMVFASLALAFSIAGSRAGRVALVIAACALAATAVIRLDPASIQTSSIHRLASGVAMVSFTVALLALARPLGYVSLALIAVGVALVATSFSAWGLWERVLLGLPLLWIVWRSAKMTVSADATTRASKASLSSAGS